MVSGADIPVFLCDTIDPKGGKSHRPGSAAQRTPLGVRSSISSTPAGLHSTVVVFFCYPVAVFTRSSEVASRLWTCCAVCGTSFSTSSGSVSVTAPADAPYETPVNSSTKRTWARCGGKSQPAFVTHTPPQPSHGAKRSPASGRRGRYNRGQGHDRWRLAVEQFDRTNLAW